MNRVRERDDRYFGQGMLVSWALVLCAMWAITTVVIHYCATHGYFLADHMVTYTMLLVSIPVLAYVLVIRKQIDFREDYHRAVLSSMQEAILVFDKTGNIRYANPSAKNVYSGFNHLTGVVQGLEVFNEEQNEFVASEGSVFLRALRGEVVGDQVVRLFRDGCEMIHLVTVSPIWDRFGQIQGVVKVGHDITEMKRVEAASQATDRLFRLMTENVTDLVGIINSIGIVVYASPSHKTLLGIEPAEFVGQQSLVRIHQHDLFMFQEQLEHVVRTKQGVTIEFRYMHASGRYVTFESNIEPIVNQNGVVDWVVVVARDITNRKREASILKGQNKVLSLIATDQAIEDVFTEITEQVESLDENVICGITLVNDEQVQIVAPSLDEEIQDSVNSAEMESLVQRYLYEEAFVNTASDGTEYPDLREWLGSQHYVAAWTRPIYTSDGRPIGTFGVIYKNSFESTDHAIELYDAYAKIAVLAVERKLCYRVITESKERYQSLFDNNLDAIFQFDLKGHFVDVNKAFEDMFGYSVSELLGRHFRMVVLPEDVERAISAYENVKRGTTVTMELRGFHKSGKQVILSLISFPIFVNGKVMGTFGVVKDITSLWYSQALLSYQKNVLEMIAKGYSLEEVLFALTKAVEHLSPCSMCNVFLLEKDNVSLRYVTGNERLRGYNDELGTATIGPNVGVCGTAPYINDIVIVEDIEHDPLYANERNVALTHGLRACFATPIVSSTGKVLGTFGLYYSDVRRPTSEEIELLKMVSNLAGLAVEHKQADDEIEYLAHNDPVTNLPNRTTFFKEITSALEDAKASNHKLAVMYLDLDNFKSVNESIGHDMGDRLLQAVTLRLNNCLGENHIMFRMNGDEFTVLLSEIDSTEDAMVVAKRMMDCFVDPVKVESSQARLTTSLGISIFPNHGDSVETLVRNADIAMYYAKNNGKDQFCLYTEAMSERFCERLMMESAIQSGIENNEFFLHFQPRMDMASSLVTSVEVLLRWQRPGFGVVPPGDFIPVAESSGLIVPLGKWVFNEACLQIKRWEQDGKTPIRIAVNVSPRQFRESSFLDMVRETIQETEVDPRWLEIEVTESGLMENETEVVSVLRDLRALGMKISIDDFGVGYSSLSRLKQMPVDTLKIDRSFIRDINEDDAVIAKTIITLAHNMNMYVVAEGVETKAQFDRLQQYGCDEIQGYYFTPPIPLCEFEERYVIA